MRIVFALVLFIGVAIAGGAVYLAMERFNQYESALATQNNSKAPVQNLETVYVAAEALKYGQQLVKENIKAIEIPASAIPETAFRKEAALLGSGEGRDFRVVVRAMDVGEFIMTQKVTQLGEDVGVSSRLKQGMRAFAIRVDVASGVSGFLRPGDRVDVYWTGKRDRETITKLILENLVLIAIDQSANGSRNRVTVARTVTVAASSKTIAGLVQAQSTGKLLLSLRGIGDETTFDSVQMTEDDLLGRKQIVTKERVCTIKTRRGAEVLDIPIPCSN